MTNTEAETHIQQHLTGKLPPLGTCECSTCDHFDLNA